MVQLGAPQNFDQSKEELHNAPKGGGTYHLAVNNAEQVTSGKKGTPGWKMTFEVLAGTIPGQEGKKFDETFWVTDGTVARMNVFIGATGAIPAGQSADDTIAMPAAVGRQFIGATEEEKYKTDAGKEGVKTKLTYDGMWPIGHKDVANIPVNQDAIRLLQGQAVANAAVGQAVQQQQQQAQQAGGNDGWGGLV